MKKYNSFKNKLTLILIGSLLSLNVFGIDLKKYEDQLRLSMNLSVAGSHIEENDRTINQICSELEQEYKKNTNSDALMFLKFFETARKENSLNLNQKINNVHWYEVVNMAGISILLFLC